MLAARHGFTRTFPARHAGGCESPTVTPSFASAALTPRFSYVQRAVHWLRRINGFERMKAEPFFKDPFLSIAFY
jgi:hypothetical protein